MCLYGDRSGNWVVGPPVTKIPGELPEPCLGINFARDGMSRKDWLALVAIHSDAWLMSVAFFYAVRLDVRGRARLFKSINTQPTLFEIATGRADPTPAPPPPGTKAAAAAAAGGGGGGGAKRRLESNGSAGGRGRRQGDRPGRPLLPPVPFKDPPASAQGSKHPDPRGRLLRYEDVSHELQGKYTELYWPDDALWYLVYLDRVDLQAKTANIIYYSSEELEQLDLDLIAKDGHMNLLY